MPNNSFRLGVSTHSTATLSNQKQLFPREIQEKQRNHILSNYTASPKGCFLLGFSPRQKSGLNRKSNFFSETDGLGSENQLFVGTTRKCFWQLCGQRPKGACMCVCVMLWLSLGNFNLSQQSHLFPRNKLVLRSKTNFFAKKCWYFGAKPRQQHSSS